MGIEFAFSRRAAVVFATLALAFLSGRAACAADAAEAAKTEQHFDVQEYRVLGNTVLTGRDIERLLYPLLGLNKTLTDVESARTALEALYHDRGYGTVFVDIPPQT